MQILRNRARLAAVVLVSLGACSSKEPNYCPNAPHDNCMDIDAAPDGPTPCTGDPQCSGATPVCDLSGNMVCVQCTTSEHQECTGTTPTCGSDDTCRACAAHADCDSNACLPDGSCGVDANVAYVDASAAGANASCTKAAPCNSVAKALATSKPFIKIHGTVDEQVSINNQNVTVLADPGAKLTSTTNGILLEVKGSSQVTVYGLEISGASGANGFGVSMPTGNTATLRLRKVTVRANTGGGLSISAGDFDIENTMIVQNGSPTSLAGGIDLASVPATGTHRIEFSTVAANAGASTVNCGINCGTVGGPVVFSNNIVYGNTVSGGGKQIGGSANCSTTYSDIGPDTSTGTGNTGMDPMFANAAQGNFHITSSSPAKDTADPAATLGVDIDGDTRPQGPAPDMGADEYK